MLPRYAPRGERIFADTGSTRLALVDVWESSAVALLAELVGIDSVNPGLVAGAAGEAGIANALRARLEQNGFTVERGVAGIPTAWTARWGSGKPVIALGSDIDDIPQASQKPGVAYHDPIVAGAPGHGEGHNSGLPLQITAALAVKKAMEREKLAGTLVIWPGVAEELLAGPGVKVVEWAERLPFAVPGALWLVIEALAGGGREVRSKEELPS